jgi:hypothetical protein
MLQIGLGKALVSVIPAENKFSTTDILTRFDRTKFITAMRQTTNLDIIKTHYVYSNR